jgi:SpoVK/Ycf46/Vps4 family AAA+-type ATPase
LIHTDPIADWVETNQRALSADIDDVRALLAAHAKQPPSQDRRARPEIVSALDLAAQRLGLSAFERKIVVMCAAMELEGSFGALCGLAQGDVSRPFPTFGLALGAFHDSHWSATTPSGPLRRFGLIEVQRGAPLTQAALRIDEAFLHDLAGVGQVDQRLAALLTPLTPPERLAPSHQRIAENLSRIFALGQLEGAIAPCVLLLGDDPCGKREIAADALAQLDLRAYAFDASALNGHPDDLEARASAWEREARLRSAALYVDAHDLADQPEQRLLARFLDRFTTPAVVAARHPVRCGLRLAHRLDVTKPTRMEQRELWMQALARSPRERADNEASVLSQAVRRVTTQFDLDAAAIQTIAHQVVRGRADPLDRRIWGAARNACRNELSETAQRLEDRPTWDELVLPPSQLDALRDIVAHARNRSVVHDEWGMAGRQRRGLGLSALFFGPSGTGKTLAAEVMGTEMDLDVYRVDLSQLVSKFVGETEKNLRRVFDSAEGGGAILLFDECDAIFGKRGEVEHGQDRYANLEVSYLLQRMESYSGIAILTTNLRSAIDPAFMRRLRFVLAFPFPAYEQRIAIWKRALHQSVPTRGIDFEQLARLNVAGGSIRNIAMHAAFLAADSGQPVAMAHLRRAALSECGKLERAPTDVEIGGWR